MKDYIPLLNSNQEKSSTLKWILGVACLFGLVCFLGVQTEHGAELKGYIQDEVFISYMEESEMTLDQPMEEVYDEESDLMNKKEELTGIEHVYDEKKDQLVPLAEMDPEAYARKPYVVGVNSRGNIFFRYTRSYTGTWVPKTGGLKNVAVGYDGTVWGVNRLGYVYERTRACDTWIRKVGLLKQVDVAKSTSVWGVNRNDYIYKWLGNRWLNIPGRLKVVSVAYDGTVWGVNSADYIYTRVGSNWRQVPGRLKQISTGSRRLVWGVNKNDEIYRWTGRTWQKYSGLLKWVCVSKTGRVWGVNKNNDIFYRLGSSWKHIPGKLTQIDCA